MKRHKLVDLKDLPDEALRITAAESMGWLGIRRISRHEFSGLMGVDTEGEDRIVPSVCNDANQIFKYEERAGLHDKSKLDLRVRWINALRDAVSLRCPKNKCGAPMVSDVDVCLASPRERTIALILTLPKV